MMDSSATVSDNVEIGSSTNRTAVTQNVSTRQNPPKFLEGMMYANWKNKLNMWTLVTSYAKKEQAIIVFLTAFESNSRAEKAASEFTADQLHTDDGMKVLIDKLDVVFKNDKVDDAYEAYTKFNSYTKPVDVNMNDFIVEFEHRYHKLSEHDMRLPESILTFKLIDAAKLLSSERQMAFTIASDMKLDSVKSALKRIFSNSDRLTEMENDDNKAITVKAEAYYTGRKFVGQKQFSKPDVRTKFYNPRNKFGEISRCAICDSKMHWAEKCPHKPRSKDIHISEGNDDLSLSRTQHFDSGEENREDLQEFVNAIFLTECRENEIYLTETSGCAILDTACTKTVCGEFYLKDYVSKLNASLKKAVIVEKGGTGFKFGDGRKVVSTKSVLLPAVIAGMSCHIQTDVVKENLPLLLSKSMLKKTRTTIDLKNDEATMLGKPVQIQFTTNGHYCIDVHPGRIIEEPNVEREVFVASVDELSNKEILKLHKQFGHASGENLIRLLKTQIKDMNSNMTAAIKDVISKCEICALHKKTPPRPVVGLSRAKGVNEVVALDLHQLEANLWYLHIIDEFSRFSNAVLINSKIPSVIIQKFLQSWVSIFGAPSKVISDNGGEFNNEEFRDMCENFNISVMTTPAYSPWSNGVCERHNQILTDILIKIKKDVRCSWDTALAWSVSAKNALINNNGFSPVQIMFGRNVNLPSVAIDNLPALEGKTISEKVGEHISALHASRQAFIKTESSEKIRRALRCNIRPCGEKFHTGEDVYYKRNDGNEWKGPARVLGQDGVLVFLRHGGQLIRAHTSRIQRLERDQALLNPKDSEFKITQNNQNSDTAHTDTDESLVDDVTIPSELAQNSVADMSCSGEEHSGLSYEPVDERNNTDELQNDPKDKLVFKRLQQVSFKNDGIFYKAEILNRAGKVTGKYRNCFNVEYKSPVDLIGVKQCVDLDRVQELKLLVPEEESSTTTDVHSNNLILISEDIDFNGAKQKELKSWQENDVFEECENEGQKCISVKWVCTLKNTNEGILPKARLVARGFEDPDIDKVEKDSPTCSKEALRTIIAVTAQKGWKLHSMDIKTAFLQGEPLKRNVYLTPPEEARCLPEKIWKLKKCVYGLTDASLQWYDRVKRFMIENGGKMTKSDPAVFCWRDGNNLQGIIAVHVDDFLWAGTEKFQRNIVTKLRHTFKIGNEESMNLKYLGLNINHSGNEVQLNQEEYISGLKPIEIGSKRSCNDPITTQEKNDLRSRIGQFLWVSSQTRPDIAYDVCVLATNFKNARVKDLYHANKVIRKLKSGLFNLKFRNLGPKENMKLVCYTDASFASLNEGGSQGGTLVFLVGENGYCNLLMWESKRIRRVVKSSLAAETLAMSSGIDAAIFVSSLFSEIWNGSCHARKLPVELVIDNLSLYEAIKSTKQVQDKRLRAIVKEMLHNRQISNVYWVNGKQQLADVLTKSGASSSKLVDVLHRGQI